MRRRKPNKDRLGPGPSKVHQGLMNTDVGAEYTAEELDFIRAMTAYMDINRRRFPAFTEVLEVAKSMGYRKVAPAEPVPDHRSGRSEHQRKKNLHPKEATR